MRLHPPSEPIASTHLGQVLPTGFQAGFAIAEAGLFWGARTCLVRMAENGRLALDDDRERLLTLLSVAKSRPATIDVLEPVKAAASYWQRGDKALANLRLVFAHLPRLHGPTEADRLQQAADLIDGGLAPRDLMKALGYGTAALDKFDPGQPRVPAGGGPAGGQWTDGAEDGEYLARPRVPAPEPRLPVVPVAADGPLEPGGIVVIPHDGTIDLLDPANLNVPPSPAEQQAIADTVNTILEGKAEDLATLNPHPYDNVPDKITGARLPLGETYTTQYVRLRGTSPGSARIITSDNGSVYYSNNHYQSFYHVDIVRRKIK